MRTRAQWMREIEMRCTQRNWNCTICSYLYSPHISCWHSACSVRQCEQLYAVTLANEWVKRMAASAQSAHSSNYKLTVQLTPCTRARCWVLHAHRNAVRLRAHCMWTKVGCGGVCVCLCDARDYYGCSSIVRGEAIIKRFWEGIRMYTINKLLSWWYYTDAIWIYYTLLLRSQLLYYPRI